MCVSWLTACMCPLPATLHCYTFEILIWEFWNHGLTDVLLFALRVHAARFLGLSERSGRILTDQRAREIYDAGYKFCRRYVALAQEAARLDPPPKVKLKSIFLWMRVYMPAHWNVLSPAFDSALFLHHTVAQTWGRWVSTASQSARYLPAYHIPWCFSWKYVYVCTCQHSFENWKLAMKLVCKTDLCA